MRIDFLTLFPAMCEAVLGESIIGRARKSGAVSIACHNIRDYTLNRQNQVDDYPYGGGTGMILQPQPIFDCFDAVCAAAGGRPHLIYMSPQGHVFRQEDAMRLSKLPHIAFLCGHYEGVDERVLEGLVDEELSIGDFVVTGGELPAMMAADAVCRLLPGVLRSDESWQCESIASGLLEYPQYSRPADFRGRVVPEILLNGHHAKIEQWRRVTVLARTLQKRPDLLASAPLTDKDREMLNRLREGETPQDEI